MKDNKQTSIAEKFPEPDLVWNDVLKVIGIIAGFIGVGGALLWLFGRYYYRGVFASFGFSSIPLSIAPEDYIESGTASLLYFIIDVLASIFLYYLAYLAKVVFYERILGKIKNRIKKILLILVTFSISIIWGANLISSTKLGITAGFLYEDPANLVGIFLIFLGLEITFLVASLADSSKELSQQPSQLLVSSFTPLAIARILILVVMFSSLLFTQAGSAFVSGRGAGCLTALRKSTSVVLFSTSQILAEGESQSENVYQYSGYFLLFADRDHYYVFMETNPETYKPNGYFIIAKDILTSIQITGTVITDEDNEKYNKMCVEKIKGD